MMYMGFVGLFILLSKCYFSPIVFALTKLAMYVCIGCIMFKKSPIFFFETVEI